MRVLIFMAAIVGISMGALGEYKPTLEQKRPQITKALQVTFEVDWPQNITPLSGGFSSGMYKIQIKEKPYVLRLSNPDRTLEDRKREVTCIKLAAQSGLAPAHLYDDVKDGVIIFEYIEKQLVSDQYRLERRHIDLANMLRTLHSGPKFPKFMSVFEVIRMVTKALEDSKPPIVDEVLKHIQKVEEVIQKHPLSAPCHNDLNSGNVLYDGKRLWFVDWEAAGQGDPDWDLATAANWFNLDAQQESAFLQTYFQQLPSELQRARFNMMKQASLAFYGIAPLVLAKMKGTDTAVPLPEQELPSLRELLEGLKTGRFQVDSLLFAHVFLHQVLQNAKNPEFEKHYKVLLDNVKK